LAENISLIWK